MISAVILACVHVERGALVLVNESQVDREISSILLVLLGDRINSLTRVCSADDNVAFTRALATIFLDVGLVLEGLLVVERLEQAVGGNTHDDALLVRSLGVLQLGELSVAERLDGVLSMVHLLLADNGGLIVFLKGNVVLGQALDELFILILSVSANSRAEAVNTERPDDDEDEEPQGCLLYTSPSPRDRG